jgi:hypothetical protein
VTLTIVALETLDCAHKVRVHYLLPQPLTPDLTQAFPEAEVRLDAFSRLVAGARDHLAFVSEGHYHAAGVIGSQRLVVTYGKPLASRPQATIDAVEAALCQTFGAELQRRKAPAQGDPA